MVKSGMKALALASVAALALGAAAPSNDGEVNYPHAYQVSYYAAYMERADDSNTQVAQGVIRWTEMSHDGEFLSQTSLSIYPGEDAVNYKVNWTTSKEDNEAPRPSDCFVTLAITGGTYGASMDEAKYLTKLGEKLSRHQTFTLLDKLAEKLRLQAAGEWGDTPAQYLDKFISDNTWDPRAVAYSKC